MEEKDIVFLEKAVINLIIEKTKIKDELEEKINQASLWWKLYNEKKDLVDKLEAKIIILEKKQ